MGGALIFQTNVIHCFKSTFSVKSCDSQVGKKYLVVRVRVTSEMDWCHVWVFETCLLVLNKLTLLLKCIRH